MNFVSVLADGAGRRLVQRSLVWILGWLAWTTAMGVAAAQSETDWPTFRGPDRTAIAPDGNLLTQWPEAGPELIWEAEGAGRGYSSLAISDGRIYTMGDGLSDAENDDEYLLCFDQATGKRLWKTRLGPAWESGPPSWQSSRSTPTVDGDRIYALTAHGQLLCVSDDGQITWRVHLEDDLGGKKADGWGYSESVLVDGDRVVCTPGGERNTMVALNKMTGDRIWSASREGDRGAGHPSIVVSQVGDTRVYVNVTGSGPMGVRASDGELLWTYDVLSEYDLEKITAVIPTPIVSGNLVFFTTAYDGGGVLLRQAAKGQDVQIREVYGLKDSLKNKHGGVVLMGGYVYGGYDDNAIVFCADLMTGEVQWRGRGSGRNSASICAADGHLYIWYSDGTMTLVRANPAEFEEVSSFEVPDSGDRPNWSHPVIVDGKLYLRAGDNIYCYQLRKSLRG